MNTIIQYKNIVEKKKNIYFFYLDISALTYSKSLMDISGMFKNCSSLEEVKFENLEIETKYLINMDEMFYGCTNLKSVNFLYFDTDRIKSMERMFYDCTSLNFLNITTFEIKDNAIKYKDIFNGVPQNQVNVLYKNESFLDELEKEIDIISIKHNNNNDNTI